VKFEGYKNVSGLFETYTNSYNLRLNEIDAIKKILNKNFLSLQIYCRYLHRFADKNKNIRK